MTALLVILGILIAVLLFLLFTPIVIEVDSSKDLYRLRWRGIGYVRPIFRDGRFLIRFRILFFTKQLDPLKKRKSKKKKARKRKKKTGTRWARKGLRKIGPIFRAIRVRHIYVNMDTNNAIINAWLYPAMRILSRGRRQLHINFNDVNEVKLKLTTSGFRFIRAFIF